MSGRIPMTSDRLVGNAVTVIIGERVMPGSEEAFVSWQKRLLLAESKFPGYRGSEIFRPIEGVQDEWTTLYRYNSAADLDRWLTSVERQKLLDEGKKFSDFGLRTIDHSFGNWFAFEAKGGHPRAPSNMKTVIAVWVGLHPTVMLLALATAPAKLPVWLDRLFSNLLSSTVMTFVTMPFYVNPMLKHWLHPDPEAPKAATNIRVAALIATVMVLWAAFFWLVTTVIWKPW
jgi:antibiotic biosynthesis monooxygenase (ABM) superfamily enzyme